jgi:large subunit ribosomal protein L13Ae
MVKPSRMVIARRQRKGIKSAHRHEIITVDLKDHVLGRAAAVIAKQLLLGKRITVVRAEQAVIAGTEIRNKIKYLNYLRKKKLTNPKKGPFHRRSPSEVFLKTIRNMLPTSQGKRGASALRRLVVYEGIPVNVSRTGTRVTIPKALRQNRLKPERAFTVVGNMCQHIGWKYSAIVKKLEAARVEKAKRHYTRTAPVRAAWQAARKAATAKLSAANQAILKKFNA